VGKKGQKRLIKSYTRPDRARGAMPRGTMRGTFGRGARGSTPTATTPNLLPPVQRTENWRPGNAEMSARGERADSRKRQRSSEEEQQRKRGTGTRGWPPLRARTARGRGAGPSPQPSVLNQEAETDGEEEEVGLPVSQIMMMGQTQETMMEEEPVEEMTEDVRATTASDTEEEEVLAGIRIGKE
jgi:hypothetical protein